MKELYQFVIYDNYSNSDVIEYGGVIVYVSNLFTNEQNCEKEASNYIKELNESIFEDEEEIDENRFQYSIENPIIIK